MSRAASARFAAAVRLSAAALFIAACATSGAAPSPARTPASAARRETPPPVRTPRAPAVAAIPVASSPVRPSPAAERYGPATTGPDAGATPQPIPAPAGTAAPSPGAAVAAGTPRAAEWFDSALYPYRVRPPQGWVARAGGFRSGDVRGDLLEPRSARDAVSITVLSEALGGRSLDPAGYARLTEEGIERDGGPVVARGEEIAVAGGTAPLLLWDDLSRPLRSYEIAQAVWVSGDRGWVVTLAAPRGERALYLPALRALLRTFETRR